MNVASIGLFAFDKKNLGGFKFLTNYSENIDLGFGWLYNSHSELYKTVEGVFVHKKITLVFCNYPHVLEN